MTTVAGEVGLVDGPLGHRIYFDPADARGDRLRVSGGNVNPSSLRLWAVALQLLDWDLVVDVGCNYGEMLAGAVIPTGAQVVAFEPNTRILPFLRKTLMGLSFSVDLIEAAVANRANAHGTFIIDTDWSGTSFLDDSASEESGNDDLVEPHNVVVSDVEVTTLDSSLADYAGRTLCMKIDVEGHEASVLEGAAETLRRQDKWAVMIEILHMTPLEISRLAERCLLFLMDRRTSALVRIPGGSITLIKNLLVSPWLYPQDALLVSSTSLIEETYARTA